MPFHSHALPLLLAAALSFSALPVPAAGSAPDEPQAAKVDASATLTAVTADFKSQPNDATWQALSKEIKALLSDAKSGRVPSVQLERSNHELTDLGLKVIEAGAAEIWTFPKIPQAREAFVRWQETKPSPPARRRPAQPASVSRVQAIVVPASIGIKEAKVVDIAGPRPATTPAAKDKKTPAPSSTPAVAAGSKTEGGRFLIMSGADRATSALWIKSYKLLPEGWRENSQPLSGIPPFLLTNVSGKLAFSGQDLLLTIRPGVPKGPVNPPAEVAIPESPSYRLALRMVNGKYLLEGRPGPDTPFNTVFQFVQALNQGRLDAAKGWLYDLKLITVARYVGLSGKASASQPRMINMAGPPPSVYRFRYVTFEKNDLIFDVVKTRTMWAIKAIFVAPADPLIQQIARVLPSLDSMTEPAAGDNDAEKTPSAGTGLPKSTGALPSPPAKPLR